MNGYKKLLPNKIKTSSVFFLFLSLFVATAFAKNNAAEARLTLQVLSQVKNDLSACKINRFESLSLRNDSLIWSANTSMTISKDKNIVTLVGGAKFKCNTFSITADEIIINVKAEKIFVKNFALKPLGIDSLINGGYGEFAIK